tara:strand:- start:67219 stop:67407 length:189 start_codon:yes stop_codon:yes gene_type:complete
LIPRIEEPESLDKQRISAIGSGASMTLTPLVPEASRTFEMQQQNAIIKVAQPCKAIHSREES